VAIMLMVVCIPLRAAEVPAETHALIEQIKRENADNVIYDKDGPVISVNLKAHTDTAKKLRLLGQVGSLRQITVYGEFLTDEGIFALGEMTNLVTLRVSGNVTNHDIIPALSRLRQIQSLDFIAMPFVPADLPYICRMTNLVQLELSHAPALGEDLLPMLTHLSRLKRLWLSGDEDFPDVKIFAEVNALSKLPELEELYVYGFSDFHDEQLQGLRTLPKLKRLKIWKGNLSAEWTEIVRTFPALVHAEIEQDGKTRIWNRSH
jgi:hypothetical protein